MKKNLIFTGGIFHPFDETSKTLSNIINNYDYESEITHNIEEGIKNINDYDLITFNTLRWRMLNHEKYIPYIDDWQFSLSANSRELLDNFMKNGGKMMAFHTSSICFDDWEGWSKLLGGKWDWDKSFHPPIETIEVSPLGNNILNILPKKINKICPKTKKIVLFFDKNVPFKFKSSILRKLKKYEVTTFNIAPSEKVKSFKSVSFYLDKLLSKNFNRSDLVLSVGGGITGDLTGFVASILKRGLNFINIPTTLLSQVDAAVGGKTGVNSNHGKNLIGSFFQPKLVICDTSFLKSLKRKEIVCGYAEILKHAVIKDIKFFKWLKLNSKHIFSHNTKKLIFSIKKSCQIKLSFVNEDVNEKNIRMILNFGHTFAHAIEVKNNYSIKTTHGEAVLSGMILATKLSVIKKICSLKTLNRIKKIYSQNNLAYTYKEFSNKLSVNKLIPYLKNDKKNNDDKINFILIKNIGKTASPNKNKISINNLKKLSAAISQY